MRKLKSFANKNLKVLGIVITGAVVGGATTGVVMAAIPDSSGIIHGCRNNLTRALTVVDSPSQSCGLGTTALDWSQNGKSSVVYRGHVSNIALEAGAEAQVVNFSPASWTQASDELNMVYGETTLSGTGSTSTNCLSFTVEDPATGILYGDFNADAPNGVKKFTMPYATGRYFFEPGSPTSRSLQVTMGNGCEEDVTVVDFAVDVVGTR